MRKLVRQRRAALAVLLLAVALTLCGCGGEKSGAGEVSVLLDGEPWKAGAASPQGDGGLRIYVTLDGRELIDLPFGKAHTLQVIQDGVGENTVAIEADRVYMLHADCDGQDCVQMGAVTRENLEVRVMGGFIVCLPHKLSVEVRGE